MEIVAAVVLGLLIWWFLSRGKQAKEAETRADLRLFTHLDDNPSGIHSSWDIDLVDMKGTRSYSSVDDPKGHDSNFRIRRRDGGTWEIKLTDESWRGRFAE